MAGLTRATELNGQKGVVEGFDAGGSGRYRVRLNGRVRPVNAKPEHVRWLRNTRITCYDGELKGNENGLHEEAPTADLIAAWREEESEIARLLQATDTCSTPSAEKEGLQSSPILVAGLEGEEDGRTTGCFEGYQAIPPPGWMPRCLPVERDMFGSTGRITSEQEQLGQFFLTEHQLGGLNASWPPDTYLADYQHHLAAVRNANDL